VPVRGNALLNSRTKGRVNFALRRGDIVLVPGAGNKYPDWERFDYIIIQQADIAGILTFEDQ